MNNEGNNTIREGGIYQGGYGTVARIVARSKKLDAEAKAIYMYLASFAGSGNVAFPSVKIMCEELNMTNKRLLKYRKQLEEVGLLSITRRVTKDGAKSNVYTLNTGEDVRVKLEGEGIKKADSAGTLPTDQNIKKEVSNNNTTNSQKSKYVFGEKDMLVAERLRAHVKLIIPTMKEPNLKAWANEIRLMHERDGRTYREIGQAVQYLENDKRFWHKQIQSPASLRRNYEKMYHEIQEFLHGKISPNTLNGLNKVDYKPFTADDIKQDNETVTQSDKDYVEEKFNALQRMYTTGDIETYDELLRREELLFIERDKKILKSMLASGELIRVEKKN